MFWNGFIAGICVTGILCAVFGTYLLGKAYELGRKDQLEEMLNKDE